MVIMMDRYNADWNMVEQGWHTHVLGDGPLFNSAEAAISSAYEDSDLIDQYIPPFVIADTDGPAGSMHDNGFSGVI